MTCRPRCLIEHDRVFLHACGADPEEGAGEVVVHRIEVDRDAVGVGILIALRKPPHDAAGLLSSSRAPT